jgi:large subunit ribosomal protein L21
MKKLIRVLGVIAGVAAVVWLTRDRLLPTPKVSSEQPPPFRHHEPTQAADAGPAPDEAPAPEPPEPAATPDDLTVIKGIGPVRSGHLAEEGITTFADLAAADPSSLAEQFDVAETAAAEWVADAAARAD